MTYNPLSGITGSVKIGTAVYAFSKWSAQMKCNLVKVTSFVTAPYQNVVAGIISCALSLDAATYDEGNMPLSVGVAYTFILGYTSTIVLTLPVLISEITPTVDVDGAQAIKVAGESNGAFTAAIL